jgi:hypothetical protein
MTFSKLHALWLSLFECMGKNNKPANVKIVNNIQTFGII